jgi:hypothetical protein
MNERPGIWAGAELESRKTTSLAIFHVDTASATIKGFEVMRMIRKRQCFMLESGRSAFCEPAISCRRLIRRDGRGKFRVALILKAFFVA